MAPPRLLYEIDTAAWLDDLAARLRRPVALDTVPERFWREIADLGADAVWLMGVWERSPVAAQIARRHPAFAGDRAALPWADRRDVCGSAYAVRSWRVEPGFGGDAGLATARIALERAGLGLWLDWIPNHVAPDHPWTRFAIPAGEGVQGVRVGDRLLACGKDPFFPAWPDTVQLDLGNPQLRAVAGAELARIARLCDGVRCDMAMLALPDVFARTWGERPAPRRGYWPEVLEAGRRHATGFGTIAEAYWGRDRDLLHQGFDAAYDKELYDALRTGDAQAVRDRATASACTVRFLENHDEPRCAEAFPEARRRAAAVVVATLPGTWLFHAGQEHGHRMRVPVTLAKGGREPLDADERARWLPLTRLRRHPAMRDGDWRPLVTDGWPDNQSHRNLLCWAWESSEGSALSMPGWGSSGEGRTPQWRDNVVVRPATEAPSPSPGRKRLLCIINWSDRRSQGLVHHGWGRTGFREVRDGCVFERDELYVDLEPWGSHLWEA